MKKALVLMMIVGLIISTFGCGKTEDKNKNSGAQGSKNESISNLKPQPNKITPEQTKHPLPKDSEPFTGKVVKVEGQKVIVDVKGATLEFEVTKDTNTQKGSKPFSGSLKDLKPNLEINVLTQKGVALALQYKG